MKKKGHFFVFEGIDGCGKSTQIQLLKKRLEQQGIRCMATREPTDGPIGSLLRQCLTGRTTTDEYSIAALFAADRLDHLRNGIDGMCGKIDQGITVISDRFVLSNYAYQSIQVPLEWLIQLNSQAMKLLRPDYHIFIDVSPDISMERMTAARFHTDRYETKEQLTKIRDCYFALFDQLGEKENILIIDGNRPINIIAEDIWEHVSHFYHDS